MIKSQTYISLGTRPNQGGDHFQYPSPKNGLGYSLSAQECVGTGN